VAELNKEALAQSEVVEKHSSPTADDEVCEVELFVLDTVSDSELVYNAPVRVSSRSSLSDWSSSIRLKLMNVFVKGENYDTLPQESRHGSNSLNQ